jgi:hypothetical protein
LIDKNCGNLIQWVADALGLLHPCNEKDLYSSNYFEKSSRSGAIAQPSEFGGWLSIQSGERHLVDSTLFFKLWRNLQ